MTSSAWCIGNWDYCPSPYCFSYHLAHIVKNVLIIASLLVIILIVIVIRLVVFISLPLPMLVLVFPLLSALLLSTRTAQETTLPGLKLGTVFVLAVLLAPQRGGGGRGGGYNTQRKA